MTDKFNYGHFFNLSDGNVTLNKFQDQLRLTIDGSHPSMLFFGKDGKLKTHIDARFEDGVMRRTGVDLLKDLNPVETQAFVNNQYRKPPLNSYEKEMEGGGRITFTEYKDGYKQIELFSKESETGKDKSFHCVYLLNKDGKLIHAFENGKVLEATNANFAERGGNDNPPEPPRDFIDDGPDIPPAAGGQIGPDSPPPPPAGTTISPDGPPPPPSSGLGNDDNPPPPNNNDKNKWPKLKEEKFPDGSTHSLYLYEDNTYASYLRGADGSYRAEYLTQDGRIVVEKQNDKNGKSVRDEHSVFDEMTEDKAKEMLGSKNDMIQAKAKLFLKLLAQKNEQKTKESLDINPEQFVQKPQKEENAATEGTKPAEPIVPQVDAFKPIKKTFSDTLKGMWNAVKSAITPAKRQGLKDITTRLNADLKQIKNQACYAVRPKEQKKTKLYSKTQQKTQAKIPVSKMMGMGR